MQISIDPKTLMNLLWLALTLGTALLAGWRLRQWQAVHKEVNDKLQMAEAKYAETLLLSEQMKERQESNQRQLEQSRKDWMAMGKGQRENARDMEVVMPLLFGLKQLEGDKLKTVTLLLKTTDGPQLRFFMPHVPGPRTMEGFEQNALRPMLMSIAEGLAELERNIPGTLALMQGMLEEQELLLKDKKTK